MLEKFNIAELAEKIGVILNVFVELIVSSWSIKENVLFPLIFGIATILVIFVSYFTVTLFVCEPNLILLLTSNC